MSTAQASTAAVVASATADDERTIEQRRRAVSNPFAFSRAEVDGADCILLSLGGQQPVVLGQLRDVPGKGVQLTREGSNLAQGDSVMPDVQTAAYYGGRNLLSRAAKAAFGEGKQATATLTAQVKSQASVIEAQAAQQRVVMALMGSGELLAADIRLAGTEWAQETASKLPAALKAKLVAALRDALAAEATPAGSQG